MFLSRLEWPELSLRRTLLQDYHRDSPLIGVRKTEVHLADSHRFAEPLSLAAENNQWRVRPFPLHLNIQPGHSFGPSCPKGFEQRLFRCEARCEMRNRVAILVAELLFSGGENPENEPLFQSFDYIAKARNLDQVNAGADDHRITPNAS